MQGDDQANENGSNLYSNKIQMELTQLEQQKISLTKELEKIQEEIDYYNLDEIANWNSDFKEMINKRDRIRIKIKEIKNILDNNL